MCEHEIKMLENAAQLEKEGGHIDTKPDLAVACQPHQRERLERLCRYLTRPAICLERLTIQPTGKVSYQLEHPFRDGTTHILFTPLDCIARLAALVPRPRVHLTRYHGVFAPNSPFRKAIVPGSPLRTRRKPKQASHPPERSVDPDPANRTTELGPAPQAGVCHRYLRVPRRAPPTLAIDNRASAS